MNAHQALRAHVANNTPLIIDGGMGTALGDESQAHVLWGAQYLFGRQGHEKLLGVHRSFLEAGADIICSNSYHASFEIFTAAGAFTDGVTLPGGSITKEKHQLRFAHDVLAPRLHIPGLQMRLDGCLLPRMIPCLPSPG